jgi:hypothetical protein
MIITKLLLPFIGLLNFNKFNMNLINVSMKLYIEKNFTPNNVIDMLINNYILFFQVKL